MRPRSTLHGYATYIGPFSLGFETGKRYRIIIQGDKLRATSPIGPVLSNVYTVGGFLCNWKDIEIQRIDTVGKRS